MAHARLQLSLLLVVSSLLGLAFGEALLALLWPDRHDNLVLVEGYDSPFLFAGSPHSVVEEDGFEYRLNNFGMRRDTDVGSMAPTPAITTWASTASCSTGGRWLRGSTGCSTPWPASIAC